MQWNDFRSSLPAPQPPPGVAGPLAALWHAAHGEWDTAHGLVQEGDSVAEAWVHAYLHRIEGDLDNAGYWYRRAGRPTPKISTDDGWKEIAEALLLEDGL